MNNNIFLDRGIILSSGEISKDIFHSVVAGESIASIARACQGAGRKAQGRETGVYREEESGLADPGGTGGRRSAVSP